jgi:hypothetical protein
MDLDEGTDLRDVSCLACHAATGAVYSIATPPAMYVGALICNECGASLVDFDALSDIVMSHDGRQWRVA